jgi:16S rRNA (cytosine1402-N4)-methyltransferase
MMTTTHVPILVDPIVGQLVEPFLRISRELRPSQTRAATHWMVDCTLGGGGHTKAFLEAFQSHPALQMHRVLAIDHDPAAIAKAQVRFAAEIAAGRLELVHCKFGEAAHLIRARPVLALMADLGFSSDQLDDAERGFSFQTDGPLDMRMDPSQGKSCQEWLQSVSELALAQCLHDWGEERFSRRIAAAVIESRKAGKLPRTTQELSEIVIRAIPASARHQRIHAATRTFQALRIAVNGELNELDRLLNLSINQVLTGGRIAILSFHSLEDRMVKHHFKAKEQFTVLTKKPLRAGAQEIHRNLRARSAKLRIAEKK